MARFGGNPHSNDVGFNVTFIGLREVQFRLAELDTVFRSKANKEIRDGAGKIAERAVMPQLKAAASVAPNRRFAMRFASVMKVKRDRAVAIYTPGKTPTLSGLRRGVGEKKATRKFGQGRLATTKNYMATLAWASEFGPYPGSSVNRYGVPRREGGYWVQPGGDKAMPRVKREWLAMVTKVLIKYGRNR